MLIWTDAHISPELASWLRSTFAMDAFPLRELGLRDSEDAVIFAAARAVGAVVMTKDSDFVDLLTRHGPPSQIIWLTCGNTTNTALRAILEEAWPLIAELLSSGEPLVEISGRSI